MAYKEIITCDGCSKETSRLAHSISVDGGLHFRRRGGRTRRRGAYIDLCKTCFVKTGLAKIMKKVARPRRRRHRA